MPTRGSPKKGVPVLPTEPREPNPFPPYPLILGGVSLYSGPQIGPTLLPRRPADQQPGTGKLQQVYKADHQSLLPEDQHSGFNHQQAGLIREKSTDNSSAMEHLLASNLEGGLSAAVYLSTLEAILDTILTESTSSLELRTSSQPEQSLPGQPVVGPPTFPQARGIAGRRSPSFFKRFMREHRSNLEDAEDAQTCSTPNDIGVTTSAYAHLQQAPGALSEPG